MSVNNRQEVPAVRDIISTDMVPNRTKFVRHYSRKAVLYFFYLVTNRYYYYVIFNSERETVFYTSVAST